jgi:5'-nucleotidase
MEKLVASGRYRGCCPFSMPLLPSRPLCLGAQCKKGFAAVCCSWAQALFEKYHPIEIDPKIGLEEKKKAMEEWWRLHFELLIKSGLNKSDLEKVLGSSKVQFRSGALKFLDWMHKYQIPVVIMSASGLGDELIHMVLEKNDCDFPNVHVVSNAFIWDEKGGAKSIKEPIIHSANKDEAILKTWPWFEEIKNRSDILLMGDNLGDVGMAAGVNHHNILKIGFLNKDVEKNLEKYKQNFDVVICGDGSMDFVNNLLSEILDVK